MKVNPVSVHLPRVMPRSTDRVEDVLAMLEDEVKPKSKVELAIKAVSDRLTERFGFFMIGSVRI